MKQRLREFTRPLAYPEQRRIWVAQVLSQLGDWAARIALAIMVERRTGSAALTGLVLTMSVLPYVGLGPVLATLGDRFPRRTVMIVSDLARAALFVAMATPLPLPALVALIFAAACFTPTFDAARSALLPRSVPPEVYGDAIGLTNVTAEVALLVGYAAGSGLASLVGPTGALLVNAGSFAASALVLWRLSIGRETVPVDARPGLSAGIRTVHGDPYVRRFAVTFTIVGFCAIAGEALAANYAHEELGNDKLAGVLAAAVPAGVIVTTLLVPTQGRDETLMRRASLIALAGSVAALAGFAADLDLPLVLLPFLALGVVFASRIPANKVAGLRIPDSVRASAFGVLNAAILGGQGLGGAVGGVIADRIGVREACVVLLLGAAAISVWGTVSVPRASASALRQHAHVEADRGGGE